MKMRLILLILTFIVSLWFFPACAKEAAPSVPEAEGPKGKIVIGILEDMSGPMGGGGCR